MSKSIKVLVFSAMCIALASVTSMIKVFEFPTGGSITLASTLFATLPGFFFGPAVGIAAGFAHGILQFFLGPYILTPVQVFIDYGLAFAAFGLSGFFAGQKFGYQKGYIRFSFRLDLLWRICLGGMERGSLFRSVQYHLHCG